MAMENLSEQEIVNLIKAVFPGIQKEDRLGILVDIPHSARRDNSHWQVRRKIAEEWAGILGNHIDRLGLKEVQLIAYPEVESNNADLPDLAYRIDKRPLPHQSDQLGARGQETAFDDIFKSTRIFLAPTEYSATAPLKNAARKFGFRAATMPGFSPAMIPALRIDYQEVARRTGILKEKLDPADGARVLFTVSDKQDYRMFFDLRYRKAHLSSARFPDPGTAGNVPSGETYIVPYEGERGTDSKTGGILPVQEKKEILLFKVEKNRAVSVTGAGPEYEREKNLLQEEPAYGNMGELGFGVLKDFGLSPINEILLDEKLGFHVAFGRSDHFGGIVSPADFSSAKRVIHLDRIYIHETQPDIRVRSIRLTGPEGEEEIFREGEYLIF